MLRQKSTVVSAEQIGPGTFGQSWDRQDEGSSTMDLCWEALERGAPHGHLVTLRSQLKGRGSHGRSWDSDGQQVMLSLLLREGHHDPRPTLTLAAGFGVYRAVRDLVGDAAEVLIKWPNDVFLRAKSSAHEEKSRLSKSARKLAGLLVERRGGHSVLGLGLNRTHTETVQLAGGIGLSAVTNVDWEFLVGTLVSHIEGALRDHNENAPGVLNAVDKALLWKGQRVFFDGEECTLLGIAEDGAIKLMLSGKKVCRYAGRLTPP